MAVSGRVIRLRYAGRCGCGVEVPVGSNAFWDAGARTVTCLGCINRFDAEASASAEHSRALPVDNALLRTDSDTSAAIPPRPGTAGGAAGREYQRRKDKRDAETEALPWGIRKLARNFFPDPQHILAWQSGERGEIAVAKVLNGLEVKSILALHDRRIPHRRSNIDHIAIGPAGIYVIDAKRYVGQRVEVRNFGGLFSPRRAELFVGGRQKTALVNGLDPQVNAVIDALSEFDLPEGSIVSSVLCFIDADWSWLSGNLSVNGSAVVGPRGLKRLVQRAGPLNSEARHRLHSQLAQRLPSMT
jgi:hypothetical protein